MVFVIKHLSAIYSNLMETIANFFHQNIVVIYFFYGLAFFCMGLIVLLESRRTSGLRLSSALFFLALFGIIHGLHEWFEMFQKLGASGAANIPNWLLLDELRLVHLFFSFVMLLMFGIHLIFVTQDSHTKTNRLAVLSTSVFVTVFVVSVLATRWLYQPAEADFLTAIDVLARYILGIPGALLAAWAIILEQRSFRAQDLNETGRDLLRVALALILYGLVGQIFTAPSFLFPANVINSDLFVQVFGIPVQLFRAVMAMLVAIFVIRALRAFETERQRNLRTANEARLAAQRKALAVQEKAHLDMERLNQELHEAVQDLTLLYDLSRTLATTLDKNELLTRAINEITAQLPRFARGIIVLRRLSGKPLACVACIGHLDCQTNAPCMQAQQITRTIEETAVPVCFTNEQLIPLSAHKHLADDETLISIAPNSAIGVPLQLQDTVIGSLVLHIHPDVVTITYKDLSLLETIAGQLSVAIENANRYEAIQEREALRGELLHQIVSAQEHERIRIARELHDSIGQALTALGLGYAAVGETVTSDPKLATMQLIELKEMSTQALTELHHLIRDLRPSLLDDLGLVPALQNQVRLFKESHACVVDFQVDGRLRRLHPDLETIVFRIVQEALTNISKYARATEVCLTLNFAEAVIDLKITDNGVGFDVDQAFDKKMEASHGWGLLGMQERATLVGGDFHIHSIPNQGTTVDVCIPLPSESDQPMTPLKMPIWQ